MRKIPLEPAVWWRCPACFRRNFVPLTPIELTADVQEQIRDAFGCDPKPGEFAAKPPKVRCKRCKNEFETTASDDDDDS